MIVWTPPPGWVEQTNVYRFMRRLGFDRLEDFLQFSREHNERFWDEMLREAGIEWFEPYTKVCDTSDGVEWSRWFIDGRLNIAANCLDRHTGSTAPAILWEGEDGAIRSLTFSELAAETARLAHALHGLGLREGDRVALVMPMIPEVVAVLYACFKLGLIAVPIFAGFGAAAIATRLEDSAARVVVTADWLERRGRRLPLKAKLDEALEGTPVEKVIVFRYKSDPIPWNTARDVWWDELLDGRPIEHASLPLDSEHRALLLYTSGTTGKPKGAVHTHAGALAQTTKEILLAFDHKPADRFFWLSDIGWMMGPWEIIVEHH
jgi:acetyl-CoA synthetase